MMYLPCKMCEYHIYYIKDVWITISRIRRRMEKRIEILHLLADETRLRLLTSLLEGSATVSELTVRLNVPQPRVSTHLALLRSAGLVSVETEGRQRAYYVDAERIGPVLYALERLVGQEVEG